MEIGMLWFDNDPKVDLCDKVQKAATYYLSKYRQSPNRCFVHPSMIPGSQVQAGAILICSNATIHPHHFWIGVHRQGEPHACLATDETGL